MNIETLEAVGGREWKVGEHHRVYFNSPWQYLGLEISRYSTGNISSASLDGEPISNSKARKIIDKCSGKLWFDVVTNSWAYQGMDRELAREVLERIRERIRDNAEPESDNANQEGDKAK